MPNLNPTINAHGSYTGPRKIIGYPPAISNFQLAITPYQRTEGGSLQAIIIVKDASYDSQTSVTTYDEAIVTADTTVNGYAALTPIVASVESDGHVIWVANGYSYTNVKGPRSTATAEVKVTKTTGQSVNVFQNYVAGSAAKDACDAIDSRVANQSLSKLMWSQYPFGTDGVRNPNCWLGTGTDLTCISPFNSYGANKKGGCLITPRHAIHAKHYQWIVGTTVYFNDMDGLVYPAVIDEIKANFTTTDDLAVARFADPLPAIIKPAKVLGTNFQQYMPHIPSGAQGAIPASSYLPVAGFCTDQEEKAIAVDYLYNPYYNIINEPDHKTFVFQDPIVSSPRFIYNEPRISGDSGSPTFLIINNQLVCLGTLLGVTGGSSITEYHSEINAYLALTGHALQDIDLSSFNLYTYP